jgi:DDE superfamily endonuclease
MEEDEAFPKVIKDVYEFMEESGAAELPEIESNYSKGIKTLRARMENIFGFIKNKFKSLKEPFKESGNQHDALVYYAIGVYKSLA